MAESDLVWEIMTYLLDHPDAQDTAEGITEWWLFQQRTASVSQALTTLVQGGLLEEVPGPDSRVHYRIPPVKRERIRSLLASRARQRPGS